MKKLFHSIINKIKYKKAVKKERNRKRNWFIHPDESENIFETRVLTPEEIEELDKLMDEQEGDERAWQD